MNLSQKNFSILLFSFLTILFKWVFSYYHFNEENLLNKLIFEINDFYYFPHIIHLLELDFSPNYLENFEPKNFITFPIFSIIFHSIFLKLFGFIGFIFLEFLSLYLFLFILVNIFVKLDIDLNLSILSSILFFILPILFIYIELFGLNLPNLENLYSFRFPRPLITSIFFFWGLYLSIKYYLSKQTSNKEYIFISIVLGLTFVSYYYNFIVLVLTFLLIFITKNFENKAYFKKNYRSILLSFFIFIIIISPFFILFYYSEPDYLSRIGLISLNTDKKFLLLRYLFEKIFSLKFLPLFITGILSLYFLFKFDRSFKRSVIFLSFLFFSSLLSPFFFITISPSVSEIYHFLNWIVIISILIPIINLILLLNYYLKKNSVKKISKFLTYSLLVFAFFIFQINHISNIEKIDIFLKKDFYKLQNLVDNNINFKNFMTFIPRTQALLILKNKKKFTTIESSFSSLDFDQLEKSFILNLKFIGINKSNFIDLIKNKKGSWRYQNEFVRYFSWYKYQANSLNTYKNTRDFSKIELEYLSKTSPVRTQQIIIPQFELMRLSSLFDDMIINDDFSFPDLIIFKKDSLIYQFSNMNYDQYCELKGFKRLIIFANKKLNTCK